MEATVVRCPQNAPPLVDQALSLTPKKLHRSSRVVLVNYRYGLHVLDVGSLLVGFMALGVCLMRNSPPSRNVGLF